MNFRYILVGLVLALILGLGSCSFSHVDAGSVGIEVNNLGSGVQNEAKPVGWYFTPPGISIHEYPVTTRSYMWTRATTEGNPINEEINFQDKNGLPLTADVGVAFHVDAARAPIFYQRYRVDITTFINNQLHNAVRSALSDQAANLGVEEIYGAKKNELIEKALLQVQKQFTPEGLDIEQLTWASNIRVPDSVQNQINAKIANEQAALAAQANVAKIEAEARARVAKAEGEAKATQIEANAISSNPQILTQRWIEKWNGQLPTYMAGNSTPMIGLNK